MITLTLAAAVPAAGAAAPDRPWLDASRKPAARAELLLAEMTLEEKVGQMTQAERGAVSGDPSLVATWRLGSVLSGGGSVPTPNTPRPGPTWSTASRPRPCAPGWASRSSTGSTPSTATATWSGRPCSRTTSAWARPATPRW